MALRGDIRNVPFLPQLAALFTTLITAINNAQSAPGCCKISRQTSVHIKLRGHCRYNQTPSFCSADQRECSHPGGVLNTQTHTLDSLQRAMETNLNLSLLSTSLHILKTAHSSQSSFCVSRRFSLMRRLKT